MTPTSWFCFNFVSFFNSQKLEIVSFIFSWNRRKRRNLQKLCEVILRRKACHSVPLSSLSLPILQINKNCSSQLGVLLQASTHSCYLGRMRHRHVSLLAAVVTGLGTHPSAEGGLVRATSPNLDSYVAYSSQNTHVQTYVWGLLNSEAASSTPCEEAPGNLLLTQCVQCSSPSKHESCK